MAHHQEQDHRSLMLHTEAIRMMQADPTLLERAQAILERWLAMHPKGPHELWDEWRAILEQRNWEASLSTSERGNQIRQASPCSCILPNEKRLEILRRCREGRL